MTMDSVHPPQPSSSHPGTNILSIGPAGSTYTSMDQSGRSLLKTFCDDFPSTDQSFVIPPMFVSVYTEVMPEHSRGLNRKEKNKYDGALKNQSGESSEKAIHDIISEILRTKKSRNPFLALFNVRMDNDSKIKVRKHASLSELNGMDFTEIKTSGEFDCIIVVKDLGTIHIEVKRTNNVTNIASAESQLNSGVQFVTNLMNAIKGSQSNFSSVRLIAMPCEMLKSPTCKTTSDSYVAHNDVCQNFTPTWNTMLKELEARSAKNLFTSAEFTTFCNILMGWYCSEPMNLGSSKTCISNDSSLSLTNQISIIDAKVQRAEITSEEQKVKTESGKQAPLSDVFRTTPLDVFQNANGIGLLYLTPTQHSLYYHFPHAIVHGHGGSGKTILCLMKIMDLIRSGANRKTLFVAPSPSHLHCHRILVRNKFNASIVKEVPSSQEANSDIVIITLYDFFNGASIADYIGFPGYDIFIDDLQDFFTEDLCNDSNLNKIGEFIQNQFIVSRKSNHLAWFCYDIVQSISFKRLLCFFPRLNPKRSAPPIVNLKHVLRNTSEIISTVEDGRKTILGTTVDTQKIVKELYKGHMITSNRVQCHRLSFFVSPACRKQFVFERLLSEVQSFTNTKYALNPSDIAILLDNYSVLAEYKEMIDQVLMMSCNSIPQTIEESIISQHKDRVILDVAKNVASFESPIVIYIRAVNIGEVYRVASRARTKLTIIDVAKSPLQYESIDSTEWNKSKNGFYNVSEVMDALEINDIEHIAKLVPENPGRLQVSSGGLTPFLLAAQLGNINTINICIDYGAKVYERDVLSDQTGAMLAARFDHLEALKYLVMKGVPIKVKDKDGNTVLHHAVEGGSPDCFKWIVQNYPDLCNTSVLHELRNTGNVEMLHILRNQMKMMHSQKSLLQEADDCHEAEELKALIKNRIKEDVSNNIMIQYDCDTARKNVYLQHLCGDDVTIFKDNGLVFENADTDSMVYSPLAWVYRGYKVYYEIDVVKTELNKSCFSAGWINTSFLPSPSFQGEEVLSYMRSLPNTQYTVGVATDFMKRHLSYKFRGIGGKIITISKVYDSLGPFPAISGKNITLHVNFGAKEFMFSPPDLAYKSVEELIKGTNMLHVASRNNQADCCKYILDTYPRLLNKTSGRGTPLHECASTGSFNSLKVLLDAGANMAITNIFGMTALDVAKLNAQPECVKELEGRLNVNEPSVTMKKKGALSRLKQNFNRE